MPKEIFDFYDRTSLKSYNLDESMRYQLNILGTLDVFTRKHSENVAAVTVRLCEYLHYPKRFTEYCTICAYLHDIGKQFIPQSILQKPSALTDEEFQIMQTHTTLGHNICMNDLKLRPYAAGTIYHHEALNGTGYPNQLTKKDIPLEGQVIRVADIYDALVSKRQYKSHIGISDTVKIIANETKPTTESRNPNRPVKDASVGCSNPKIVKALIKVVIDDTEYEISCVMDYIKQLNVEIKRLSQVKKYNEAMNKAKDDKSRSYYFEGMKALLVGGETVENYSEILDNYIKIVTDRQAKVDNLFEEIKIIKKIGKEIK